jgi:hypothetical protein
MLNVKDIILKMFETLTESMMGTVSFFCFSKDESAESSNLWWFFHRIEKRPTVGMHFFRDCVYCLCLRGYHGLLLAKALPE